MHIPVDGVPTDAATLTKLLRGTDVIGSKCKVTAKRGGVRVSIHLCAHIYIYMYMCIYIHEYIDGYVTIYLYIYI